MFKQSPSSLFLAILFIAINFAALVAATNHVTILELYMHDIFGGSNPTARPIKVEKVKNN